MDEKDILKGKLVTFLKSNNAYECFIHNMEMYSSHKFCSIDLLCSHRVNLGSPRSIILGSFFWDRTPEGDSFWGRLSDLFYEDYESLPYESIADEEWDNMWDN